MAGYSKGELLQLSNGITYVIIAKFIMDDHEYLFLSPKGEDEFFLGEVMEEDGKSALRIIHDIQIFEKVQQYYFEHPDSFI